MNPFSFSDDRVEIHLAASTFSVSERTINRWIDDQKIQHWTDRKGYRYVSVGQLSEYKRSINEKKKQLRLKRRLADNMRERIRKLIRNGSRQFPLLGCNRDELMSHLEQMFTEGMTWENYGSWHVDHIKPICTYNLEDESELAACFHYTNLRPLWAEDNIRRPKRCASEIAEQIAISAVINGVTTLKQQAI